MYDVLRVLQGSLYEKIPLMEFFKEGEKWQIATDDLEFDELQLMLNF